MLLIVFLPVLEGPSSGFFGSPRVLGQSWRSGNAHDTVRGCVSNRINQLSIWETVPRRKSAIPRKPSRWFPPNVLGFVVKAYHAMA
jgi:hypothetical protein